MECILKDTIFQRIYNHDAASTKGQNAPELKNLTETLAKIKSSWESENMGYKSLELTLLENFTGVQREVRCTWCYPKAFKIVRGSLPWRSARAVEYIANYTDVVERWIDCNGESARRFHDSRTPSWRRIRKNTQNKLDG